MLNSLVGLVIGGLQLGVGQMGRIGLVMKAAMGQWATEALVKEEEQEGDLDALAGEPVAVAGAVALKQAVAFQLTQVVAELVQFVGIGRQAEAGEDGLMDLFGRPAADFGYAVQEDLQQANDSRFVDLDSGVANGTDGNRQGDALKQREVDMDVEPLRLE